MRTRLILTAVAAATAVAVAVIVYGVTRGGESSVALAQPAKGSADPRSAAAKALSRPLDTFGLALLRHQATSVPEGNVVVSPVSLHAVLSMVLNGADGETAAEMRRTLGLVAANEQDSPGQDEPASLSLADLNQGWADLIWLAQRGKKPAISIADSLWLRDGVAFRQPFLDTNRDYFAAEMHGLPADPDEAAGAINDWVEERTAGRITDIVRPASFSPQTILALFNTVHLKVRWDHFVEDDTLTEPFTLAGGEQVDVPMMHALDLEAPVIQTDEYDAVALSTDGPVNVWIVVPRATSGVGDGPSDAEALLAAFDAQRLEELYTQASVSTGHLALPRFTVEYEAKRLMDDLAAMGMPRAFSPGEAEFPGIADVGGERIFISEVVQKTFVDLNEQGVEAAAASGAIMQVTSAPMLGFDIRADRPFLFVLTEEATQAPLFMGLVRDPR